MFLVKERMATVSMLELIPLVHSMIANDSSVVAMRRQVDVDQRQMDDIDGGEIRRICIDE